MLSIRRPNGSRFRRDFGALVGIQHTGDRRWAPRRLFEVQPTINITPHAFLEDYLSNTRNPHDFVKSYLIL